MPERPGRVKGVWIVSLAFFVLAVVSCRDAPPPEPRTRVHFWHTFNGGEAATAAQLVEAFERQHPHIQVEVTVLSFGAARNRILAAAQADQLPEVARAEVAWITEFAAAGMLEPAEPLADTEEALRPFLSYGGQVWAWPLSLDGLALLYNRRHLAALPAPPPATLAALEDVARRLTHARDGRTQHGLYLKAEGYAFLPILWAMGGETVDPASGEVGIDSAAAAEALRFVARLRAPGGVAPSGGDLTRGYEDELRRFGAGEVSMILNGPWALEEVLRGPAFREPGNLGVAPVPRGPAGQGGTPLGGHGLVVFQGPRAEPARALARFLSSPEAQAAFARSHHILPGRRRAYDDPALSGDPLLTALRAAFADPHPRAVFPGMARLFDALTPALQRVLRGELTPEAALAGVAAEWREIVRAQR